MKIQGASKQIAHSLHYHYWGLMQTSTHFNPNHIMSVYSSALVTGPLRAAGQQLRASIFITVNGHRGAHSLLSVLLTQVDSPWKRPWHHSTTQYPHPTPNSAYISLESEQETARTATDFQSIQRSLTATWSRLWIKKQKLYTSEAMIIML